MFKQTRKADQALDCARELVGSQVSCWLVSDLSEETACYMEGVIRDAKN